MAKASNSEKQQALWKFITKNFPSRTLSEIKAKVSELATSNREFYKLFTKEHGDVVSEGMLFHYLYKEYPDGWEYIQQEETPNFLNGPTMDEIELKPIDIDSINQPVSWYKTNTVIDKLFCRKEGKPGVVKGTVQMVIGESGVGKTVLCLGVMSMIKKNHPRTKMCYLNSEMNRLMLTLYKDELPNLKGIDTILLNDFLITQMKAAVEKTILQGGYDFILIDSMQDILEKLKAVGLGANFGEAWFIGLMCKAAAEMGTTFFCITHMTKGNNYVGRTFIKHSTDAMMEIRFDDENPRDRYLTFSKNRVGEERTKLYFKMDKEDNSLAFDENRYYMDKAVAEQVAEMEEEEEEMED